MFVVFLFYNEIWFWFKKYAIKKTVRGELGQPNGFPPPFDRLRANGKLVLQEVYNKKVYNTPFYSV